MVESQKLPEYNMDTMPLRRGHILILMIASAGQFFGGALAILVGVIAPLIAMTQHPGLSPWLQGFIFACGLINTGIFSFSGFVRWSLPGLRWVFISVILWWY